jgi:hypothetical protein
MSEVLTPYLTGIGIVIGITVLWVAVQTAWRRTFPEAGPPSEPDPLAGRLGCHGCGCAGSDRCERHRPSSSDPDPARTRTLTAPDRLRAAAGRNRHE